MDAKEYYKKTRMVETRNWTLQMALNFADEFYEAKTKQLHIPVVVGQSEQLANFCKKISKQEDCPAEFQEIVNKEFWNIIG